MVTEAIVGRALDPSGAAIVGEFRLFLELEAVKSSRGVSLERVGDARILATKRKS
jgi:hypothetical protein